MLRDRNEVEQLNMEGEILNYKTWDGNVAAIVFLTYIAEYGSKLYETTSIRKLREGCNFMF